MLNKKSPLPLYHQLAELLLAQVRDGSIAEGQRIPSENVLAAEHGIGRPTVRQAIDNLVRRGILIRKRGSGTYVAPQREEMDLFSLAGTMASFKKTGHTPRVELLQTPQLQDVGNDPENSFAHGSAFFLRRLSHVEDTPVLVEDIYLHPVLFAGIADVDLNGQSLSQLVRDRFHLECQGGRQHFRIVYPGADMLKLLALSKSTPMLKVSRYLHFPDAPNAIYSALYCRTDRFVFTQTIGGLSNV